MVSVGSSFYTVRDFGMTHASLKYAQLLTQGKIFQGDLFMPTKYQRDGPNNDQDCVQHSGPKCGGFVDENQPPTRQVDFGEAQGSSSWLHVGIWTIRLAVSWNANRDAGSSSTSERSPNRMSLRIGWLENR